MRKKVHPQIIIKNKVPSSSFDNISTTDPMNRSGMLSCRLCKSNSTEKEHNNELILPCLCVDPIHRNCIRQERQKMSKKRRKSKNSSKKQEYTCQRCFDKITYNQVKHSRCRTCSQVGELSKQKKCLCFSLTFSFILMIIFLTAGILFSNNIISVSDSFIRDAIVIGMYILFGLLLLIILLYVWFEVLFVESDELILKVNNKNRKSSHKLSVSEYQ